MTEFELNSKTVLELRKIAKELHVPLGAGITKQGIVTRLARAMTTQSGAGVPTEAEAADHTDHAADAPAEVAVADHAADEAAVPADTVDDKTDDKADDKPEAPAESAADEAAVPADKPAADAPAQSPTKPAYTAPRFNSKPAYQAPTYGRQPAPRAPAATDTSRPQVTRATSFHSRFGPAPQNSASDYSRDDERPVRTEPSRPAYAQPRSNYGEAPRYPQRPAYEQRQPYDARPAYDQRPAYEQRQPYDARPAYDQRPAYEQRQPYDARPAYDPRPAYDSRSYAARQGYAADPAPFSVNPAATDIMQITDYPEYTGILEMLPEGYGFLRSENMIAVPRDIYVTSAQCRRFGLRSGDRVTGKIRPLRDGDKYPTLLTVSMVNGLAPESAAMRPAFDQLTPVYPTRRIHLECPSAPQYTDLRLMDLLTPIGFGQRGLIQCAPGTGKTRLLTRLANVICANHPDAEVMLVLFNENPEDVTRMREAVPCTVLATTFDMTPENHLRLADLALERAERLAELKRDVVLLVDSLTTLTRVISTSLMQSGRAVPGMINPQSLQKAKRLFGAARCLREGGSLTVIAAMNTDSGQKADDSVVGEFRGAANMELVLDQGLMRAGLYPPFDLGRCITRRAESIMSPAHVEGLKLLRGMLSTLPGDRALRELISMLDKATTNDDLLARIKVWAESMRG